MTPIDPGVFEWLRKEKERLNPTEEVTLPLPVPEQEPRPTPPPAKSRINVIYL